jgi:predicted transcriptional regulator
MKYKLITLYIALFWLAIFLAGVWIFTVLFRASAVPEFGAGLIGGVVYALVMRELFNVVRDSFQDFVTEYRNGLTRSEHKAIKAGLKDAEAGRTKPLEQVRAELRERERLRRGEVCSDKSHWSN